MHDSYAIELTDSTSLSPVVSLRDYQLRAVTDVRSSYRQGHRAPLLVMPTASGKTHCFTAMTAGAQAKSKTVLVVAHRRELIQQASDKLNEAGVIPGIICAGFATSPDHPVQVGSICTLINRLDTIPRFDLIIIDEAHHSVSPSYSALFESQPQAKLLGVTATPIRLDGKGLGVEHGGPFDDLVVPTSISGLVRKGYLSPPRLFIAAREADLSGVHTRGGDYVPGDLAHAMREAKITGDAVVQYRRHADHRSAIAFCVTVDHAEEVAAQFRSGGYRSACVHGGTPKKERDALINGLATGQIEVLTSCDLISEGLDVPSVGATILLRPTQSLTTYLQQVGRGMRPAVGKNDLLVLDHVGNVRRHGAPDMERAWSLSGIIKQPVTAATSERQRSGVQRDWSTKPGTLIEVSRGRAELIRAMPYRQVIRSRLSELELNIYASARGYKPGWVWHRLQLQRARHRRAS